jgi:septum formation protein
MRHRKIILASQSVIRAQMLREVGLRFETKPANIDEKSIKSRWLSSPSSELALQLSDAKAALISHKFPDALVISSDQIGVFQEKLLNKLNSTSESYQQLLRLSGQRHQLITATSLYLKNECLWHTYQTVALQMKLLSEADIADYIKRDQPVNTVGGYYYEQHGKDLFVKIDGSTDTILGLEREQLLTYLKANTILM